MRIALLFAIMLGLVGAMPVSGGQTMKIEKVTYFNQPNCYKITNGEIEVIVTTDIGPRIIRYSYAGGENILAELSPDAQVKTEYGTWHPWGGHRLWHAPEVLPRSYVPDDTPITAEVIGSDSIRLTQPVEAQTGIQKEILVRMHPDGHLTVTQQLTNRNPWEVELAVWGLTIVNGGGTTIIPNEPFIPHEEKLLPARPLVLWHYTDLSDSRWTFGRKYLRLKTDEKLRFPQKIGVANRQGWAGYLRKDTLFIKMFPYIEGANYPDLGCNNETYTDGNFMEVETLGPLTKLESGKSAVNTEEWFLFNNIKTDGSEESLDALLKPLVQKAKQALR